MAQCRHVDDFDGIKFVVGRHFVVVGLEISLGRAHPRFVYMEVPGVFKGFFQRVDIGLGRFVGTFERIENFEVLGRAGVNAVVQVAGGTRCARRQSGCFGRVHRLDGLVLVFKVIHHLGGAADMA